MLPRYNNYHSRVVILETRRARTAMPKRKFPRPGFLVSVPLVTLDQAYTAAVAQAGRPSAALTLASSSSCASSLSGSRELREPAAIGSSKARRDSQTSFVEPIRFHEARQDLPRSQCTARCLRSVARGFDPAKFGFLSLARAPFGTSCCLVVCPFFTLRELETAPPNWGTSLSPRIRGRCTGSSRPRRLISRPSGSRAPGGAYVRGLMFFVRSAF